LDKFSATELVELLKWSIPQSWRTKFNIDGYVPTTSHSKGRLITECEAIKCNEPKKSTNEKLPSKSTVHKKSRGSVKKTIEKSKDSKQYYCTEHGKNPTHGTENCYKIKNRKANSTGNKPTLTKQ
jgi:hypothetical protein